MKKMWLMLFLLGFAAAGAIARAQTAELVKYDDPHGFSTSYFSDWTKEVTDTGVSLNSPDGKANVTISYYSIPGGSLSAKQFLETIEKNMQVTNIIPDAKRVPNAAQVKVLGADECVMGGYKYLQDGVPLIMSISMARKGEHYFMLVQVIEESSKDKYAGPVGTIAKKLRITK